MDRQLFFIFFLIFYINQSVADDDAWNCNDEGDQGWSCGETVSKENAERTSQGGVDLKPAQPIQELALVPNKTIPVEIEPPKVNSDKNDGWNCYANAENETWNCQLTGIDPKGEVQSVEEKGRSFSLFSDAFRFDQEQTFEKLASRLPYDPWESCSRSSTARIISVDDDEIRESSPMNVTADYSEVFDKEITSFFGNVEVSRADQKITADRASYNSVSETMDAQGQVFYIENELSLFSDSMSLNLATDEARLRNALFISPSGPIRGSADVVYRDSKVLSRYTNAAITSCRPGNQDWVIHAEKLKMNKQTGKASARNAWLEFKSVPVLYTPYISYPIDDRRISGLLIPTVGSSDENGVDISIPYYWNIAPNYDLTVWPRFMTRRGAMLGGEFRYLEKMTAGSIGVEFLPYDFLKKDPRYSGTFKNKTQFLPNLLSDIDLNYVSDKEYFDELNNSLGFSNDRYLQSHANLNYFREGLSFSTNVEFFQTIDNNVKEHEKPYFKLPQVTLNLDHSFDNWPIELAMENEYVYFYDTGDGRLESPKGTDIDELKQAIKVAQTERDKALDEKNLKEIARFDATIKTKQTELDELIQKKLNKIDKVKAGHRINLKPSIAIPLEADYGFITPKLSLQFTQYFLDQQLGKNDQNEKRTVSDNVNRTVPIVSVDSGLFFDKELTLFGGDYLHTIEPRLFYLYVPKKNQENIPEFDSSLYDFNYSSLFRENRFSGTDRIQDANQLTMAVTSRLIDPETGSELLKLNLGEIFYFRDREVTVRGGGDDKANHYQWSNLVAELEGQLTDHWSFSSGLQWNPKFNQVVRGDAEVAYRGDSGKILNLGYRYRKANPQLSAGLQKADGSIIQADASFRWPIYDNWYGVGRWQYSLKYNATRDSFLGIEKESCCWRFRIIWRRFANTIDASPENTDTGVNASDSKMDEGIFVQIELKGLSSFGDKVDDFLEQNLKGYQRVE